MAVHAAIYFRYVHQLPLASSMYTFGQPRIGDGAFTTWFASAFGGMSWFRVVHWHDPIPHLPPAGLGFQHIAREIWYTAFCRAL